MWVQARFGSDEGIYGIIEEPSIVHPSSSLLVTLPALGQAMSEKNFLFSNLRKRLSVSGGRIVQFDYRGHGDSYGELGEVSVSTMVNDALTVLSAVTQNKSPSCLFLVGNALGSIVAQKVALEWEKETGIICVPILISPPLKALPPITRVFQSSVLELLEQRGSIDSQLLVPGYDYYTLSDFNAEQYSYFTLLGAHMLYLHGQCISKFMLAELDGFDPVPLFNENLHGVHIVCGEQDGETLSLSEHINHVTRHTLTGVFHYYQHPASMDQLIDIIESIVGGITKSTE